MLVPGPDCFINGSVNLHLRLIEKNVFGGRLFIAATNVNFEFKDFKKK